MRGAKGFAAVVFAGCAIACSAGNGGDTASSSPTSPEVSRVQPELYLSELPADGSPSFKPGEGVVGGTRYPRSFVWSCEDCLPIGQAGQQGQPGMEFTVPAGFRRLEFVAGLTDSSTVTDRSAYVGVWAEKANELTKLFESSDVTVGVGIPVSVPVTPGNKIRIDGSHLNGNETLCICDPKLIS
jgi:hypothetical protein